MNQRFLQLPNYFETCSRHQIWDEMSSFCAFHFNISQFKLLLCYLCSIVNKILAHVIWNSFTFHFIFKCSQKNVPTFPEFGLYIYYWEGVVWIKSKHTRSAMLSLSCDYSIIRIASLSFITPLLWPHGILKCPLSGALPNLARSSRSSGYFSLIDLWILRIWSIHYFHILFSITLHYTYLDAGKDSLRCRLSPPTGVTIYPAEKVTDNAHC